MRFFPHRGSDFSPSEARPRGLRRACSGQDSPSGLYEVLSRELLVEQQLSRSSYIPKFSPSLFLVACSTRSLVRRPLGLAVVCRRSLIRFLGVLSSKFRPEFLFSLCRYVSQLAAAAAAAAAIPASASRLTDRLPKAGHPTWHSCSN